MKKLIAILLVLLMTLGLVACAEKDAAVAEGLSVGYAIADINPTTSMALDGYSGLNSPKNRRSGPTEWPLQAVVTAITDAKGQTVMIVALDLLNAYMADGMRDVIAGETGIQSRISSSIVPTIIVVSAPVWMFRAWAITSPV